jgi:hypothetical protein
VLRPVSVVCWCCFFSIVKLGVVLLRFGCHLSSYAYWTLHIMHANAHFGRHILPAPTQQIAREDAHNTCARVCWERWSQLKHTTNCIVFTGVAAPADTIFDLFAL